MSGIRGPRLRVALTAFATLAMAATLSGVAVVHAGTAAACRVRHVESGITRPSLQGAVNAASDGDHLRLRGTCHGLTRIGKDLHIAGIRTATSGAPIVDGDELGTVLTVRRGVTLDIVGLTVRHGRDSDSSGGGIVNRGTLTLRDVMVRANSATAGGGILNTGTLRLVGTTSIRANASDPGGSGGGIVSLGVVVMRDSSSIRGNTTPETGGGIALFQGRLVMRDESSITGNTAGRWGGGVYHFDSVLVGVTCGGNVHDNEPDDCSSLQ